MFTLTRITCLLAFSSCCESNSVVRKLIERAYGESNSATVYFIGIDNEFLRDYINFYSATPTPVSIYNSLPMKFDEHFPFSALLVVENLKDSQIVILQELIPSLRERKFVIVLESTIEKLQESFLYFAKEKFTRIFGVVDGVSYTYFPFADIKVLELPKNGILLDAYQNLNGFTFRTFVQDDIPRVFRYPDKHEKLKIAGCFGEIFINFLQRHNATFEESVINNCSGVCYTEILNAIKNNEIDISLNGNVPQDGFDHSYPMKMPKATIMVPLNGHLDPNQYFLKPFSPTVWMTIGITLLYIVAMDVFKNRNVNSAADVDDIWKSFSQMFLVLLCLPSGRQITKHYRLHVQVMVLSFILGNIYIIHFTSYLTVFIKVKQYETIQDLVDNNVRVMMAKGEWEILLNKVALPPGFESIVKPSETEIYVTERNSMKNTNFAYFAGSDRAEFLINLQSAFSKPKFHTTRDGFVPLYVTYIMSEHSPFMEILNKFIVEILQTGLMMKWDRDTISKGLLAGFQVNDDRKDGSQSLHVPLTVRHLSFAWNVLTIGIGLALLVFSCELLNRKFNAFTFIFK